jgi:hypothetical protein
MHETPPQLTIAGDEHASSMHGYDVEAIPTDAATTASY